MTDFGGATDTPGWFEPDFQTFNPGDPGYEAANIATGGAPSQQPNVGLGGAASTALVDGRNDKPTPLSRWYATVVSLPADAVTITLDDDSNGRSTITVPSEVATPVIGDRVIVDFRPDGLVAITAVVS